MDALAAKQLEKRKSLEEKKKREQDDNDRPTDEKLSREERIGINRVFGILDPPTNCYAVGEFVVSSFMHLPFLSILNLNLKGKDESAAVWWTAPPPVPEKEVESPPPKPLSSSIWNQKKEEKEPVSLAISGWEVHRYRKDKSNPKGEWLYKGYNTFPLLPKTQVIILNLTNDFEYRFEVKALNGKGKSVESLPSNPVMVEAPLPGGWHRFFDQKSQRFYYSNLKIGKSLWNRPEQDPLFLDENLLFNFEEKEIVHLKSLFDEDMHHYKFLGVNQFMDILEEVGDKSSRGWVTKVVKIYTKNSMKVDSWQTYMEIMNHFKTARMKASRLLSRPIEMANVFYTRTKMFSLFESKWKKMGDWYYFLTARKLSLI